LEANRANDHSSGNNRETHDDDFGLDRINKPKKSVQKRLLLKSKWLANNAPKSLTIEDFNQKDKKVFRW